MKRLGPLVTLACVCVLRLVILALSVLLNSPSLPMEKLLAAYGT